MHEVIGGSIPYNIFPLGWRQVSGASYITNLLTTIFVLTKRTILDTLKCKRFSPCNMLNMFPPFSFTSVCITTIILPLFIYLYLIFPYTCPNHFSLFYIIIFDNKITPNLSFTYSFFVLVSIVTPLIYLSLLVSATFIFRSIFLSIILRHCPLIILYFKSSINPLLFYR